MRAVVKGREKDGKRYDQYPHSDITDKIIGCAIEVHRTLGPGFVEAAYENALLIIMFQ
jgi:hypothetical protein